MSPGLERVREVARRDAGLRFTNLLHHITEELLEQAYHSLNAKAAPGVDRMTWAEYGRGVKGRIKSLHKRVHHGSYRAQPSLRTYIPKTGGRKRPLGIASLEDKIVQMATVWVMQAIYEVDFVGFSYGFRPGLSQHKALDAVSVAIMYRKVSWVLDADIHGFFDSVSHDWLLKFVGHRIGDQRVLRLIHKWLKAGVSEDGQWSSTVRGTPQGATISPILANIYLHYVLDLWVKAWRKEHANGEVYIVRYADDFVMGFQYQEDAKRFQQELQKRLAHFGLELNNEKTRLVEFGRFAAENRSKRGEGKPETFDFLGFTHICSQRLKDGRFMIQRKSNAKRMRMKAKAVSAELMRRRHDPVKEQGRWLKSVLQGYYNYHAIPGNIYSLGQFRNLITRAWLKALRRRSQKARRLTWARMRPIIDSWLPQPRILHPYPIQRFAVTHPR
jgi:group II intron reverse transcriptase/maturase